MKFDSSMIYVLLAAFVPLLILILAIFWDRHSRKRTEKPPQTDKLLRPPGHSLSIRLEKTYDSLVDSLLAATFFSAFSGICVVWFASLLGLRAQLAALTFPLVVGVLLITGCVWFCLRVLHTFKRAQDIKLGLRGEQAVAEALNEAAECGFRSFHDFPAAEEWNIDHVVVGRYGVFLVETKACRRRRSTTTQAAHEVFYDGEFLRFPHFQTTQPIDQAQRNAKWLSNYLRNKTGEPVEVFPTVVLPGWFVKTTEKGNFRVSVMNANYLSGFLRRQTEKIEPSQVRRIITTLDEKCRTVEF